MIVTRIKWTFIKGIFLWRKKSDEPAKDNLNFSHIFRKKTLWELMRLSSIIMGIELAYSVATAFVSPILLNIGIHHKYMTMVWSLSAFLGIMCVPIIGPLSDNCRLLLGRRRPLMIFMSVLLTLGLILVPYGATIGKWLDKTSSPNCFAILFTIIGTIMLDFSSDNCQTPSRAYLLDMCLPTEQSRAQSIFSIMSSVGNFLGYAIGSFDWNSILGMNFLGGNIATVFAAVVGIFIVCTILTLTTFREMPLSVIENQSSSSTVTACKDIEEIRTRRPSFSAYIKSIIRMPSSLKILVTMCILCWMGELCCTLYFTDFVGEAVFQGNPVSDTESPEYVLYEEGVRFGCCGMTISAFSSIIFSMSLESLMKIFRAKCLLIGSSWLFSISMICLAVWPTKVNVLVFSIFGGIYYSIIFTIPYILIAQYHAKGCFRGHSENGKKEHISRGLGTDIAIINSSIFVAQIFVSLTIGSLISLVGSTSAVIYCAGVFSLFASIVANRVLYLE